MLHTASAIISFHGTLEDQVRLFYEALAREEKYSRGREAFLKLAKENKNHQEAVLRSYREVITDALEAAFPRFTIEEKDFQVDTEVKGDFPDIVEKALKLEKTSQNYCSKASESLKGLLADVPEAFKWVASRKSRRIKTLESLK